MDAERKVINGLFPVTTTKAVYIDGTNKTLQEAINNGEICGEKYTRILIPSCVFILFADIFFVIISIFEGGMFRGWLRKK